MQKCHDLKTDSEVFQAVISGEKTWEIRYDDRGFKVGDMVQLRETKYSGSEMRGTSEMMGKPLQYTGGSILADITYILRGPVYGLADGWAIMTIKPLV